MDAWRCKEEYTADGKLLNRERSLGAVVVKGWVVTVFVIAVVILTLSGHPLASLPVGLGGSVLKWIGK